MYASFLKIITICISLSLSSCIDWLKSDEKPSEPETLELSTDNSSILTVKTKLENKTVSITIDNIPEDSNLRCELDYQPHTPCTNSMTLKDLSDGEYLLHIIAHKDDKTLAVGESFFVIGKTSSGIPSIQENNELSLKLDTSVKNGMARNLENDASVTFSFIKKPSCDPELFCSHGDKVTSYWKNCSENNSHKVEKKFLANGLQYIHVRAQCKNKIGPTLSHYFYGVDPRYFKNGKPQSLTLDFVHDRREKKYIFHLMKSNDCTESQLKFLCQTGTEAETKCDRVHVNPPESFSIRAECSGDKGPKLSLKGTNEG